MRARRSLSFVSATAVAWAICASAAAAQAADDPQTPTQVAQATAPGASAAQDSRSEIAQSENQAGEIVVTANKREQNLNKVGLTISALTGESLANQRIANVQDLAKATPGLAYAPTPNATPVYTLRGVGFFETTLAAYPDVSVYLDQVPLSLPVMTSLTAFDLERVEVLKGPQGTLFGNNATGGAINFIAARPTSDFAAGVEIGYGRFNTFDIAGFISGPITDTLRARFAVKAVNGDEWQYSYTRDDKIGKVDNIAARLILDWEASERLNFSLNINGWRNQDDPQSPQYVAATPQTPPGSVGFGGVVGNLPIFTYPVAPDKARAADWNPHLRPYADHKFFQTSLRGDWGIFDDITLTSITGYNRMRFLNATNGSGSALELQDIGRDHGKIRSFTQELRLANSASNALRWVLGANYERTKVVESIDLYIRGTSASALNGFNGNQYGSTQTMKNYAAFGNIEYDVADSVTLKGGIRRTKATRTGILLGSYEIPGFYAPGAFGENSLTKFFNAVYGVLYPGLVPTITPGGSITLDTRTNADGTPVDPSTYLKTGNPVADLTEHNTSWSVGADFKPTDRLLLYANVSKGYKAGSYPSLAGAIYDAYAPVKQESLLNYEVGFKAQLLDRRLSVNGAAFYYDYKNKQTRAKFIDPIFGALDKLLNIPKSVIKGAEIELNARPSDGLSLTASVTYLDAEVEKYEGVIGSHPDPVSGLRIADTASAKGVSLPFAPKWQFAIRGDYNFPVSESLNGFVGAGVTGQTKTIGSIYIRPEDKAAFKIDGYTLVNANIGVETSDSKWRMSVWGKNIFNKFYWTNTIQAYDNIMRYTGRPAEYGVSVGLKF